MQTGRATFLAATDGATFGFVDEAAAGLGYLLDKLPGEHERSYEDLLTTTRGAQKQAETGHPYACTAGQSPAESVVALYREENADPKDRAWAANAVAPYVHPRLAPVASKMVLRVRDTIEVQRKTTETADVLARLEALEAKHDDMGGKRTA